MQFTEDVARGAWIAPRLGGWGVASSFAPTGFPAYARVLHPVSLTTVVDGLQGPERIYRPASWHGVAAAMGTVAHPCMQWDAITRGLESDAEVDGWGIDPPDVGDIGERTLAALAALLPDGPCTIGIWSGWGGLSGGVRLVFRSSGGAGRGEPGPFGVDPRITRATFDGPLLVLPHRAYVLLAGEVEELRTPGWASRAGLGEPHDAQLPNLIWPDDRSWFVATEIDHDSTIVGGDAALIDRVLGSTELEAVPIEEDADLTSTGDALDR
jgi:hypothetical protein